MTKNKIGGVSYESDRNSYRGTVQVAGKRYRTKRYPTRLGAIRALNKLINSELMVVNNRI